MDPVSIPPSKSLSSSIDPVVKQRILLRASSASAAVWKSIETICLTISFNLVTLASEIPLTSERRRIVPWAIFDSQDIDKVEGRVSVKNEKNQTGAVIPGIPNIPIRLCGIQHFEAS